MGNIRLYLKAKEKIFINGAVLQVDRKVAFELLNDATFLLENHVMQKEDANTPLKQLYFVVQLMLMHPNNAEQSKVLFKKMVSNLMDSLETKELIDGVTNADTEISSGKEFAALKTIRSLFPVEEQVMRPKDEGQIEAYIAETKNKMENQRELSAV